MEDVKKDRYPCWNGASVVSIVFDSLHIFISELLDYLLPIKNGYIMGVCVCVCVCVCGGGGGGGPFPWGRRHWIGINFCHPEVKLQQQCQMQNTIFD